MISGYQTFNLGRHKHLYWSLWTATFTPSSSSVTVWVGTYHPPFKIVFKKVCKYKKIKVEESYLVKICDKVGDKYRFGFNGMEKDNEVKGIGNSLDFGARIYDSRVGRFLSLDPKIKEFPWQSPYLFANNMPINTIDKEGKNGEIVIDKKGNENPNTWTITATQVYLTSYEQLTKFHNIISIYENFANVMDYTWGKKTFKGNADGINFEAKFVSKFPQPYQTDEQLNEIFSRPRTHNSRVTFNKTQPTEVFFGNLLNYNPFQTHRRDSYGHEASHIWGEAGDDLDKYDNWMSSYDLGREVQDDEVLEILAPAIKLASQCESDVVTIRFFASRDENGKYSSTKNTYQIYNKETKEYGQSLTVNKPNMNLKNK